MDVQNIVKSDVDKQWDEEHGHQPSLDDVLADA